MAIMLCASNRCAIRRISNPSDIFPNSKELHLIVHFFSRSAAIQFRFSLIFIFLAIKFEGLSQQPLGLFKEFSLTLSSYPSPYSLSVYSLTLLMSDLSPTSPLSTPTSSNGSSNSQNLVSSADAAAQPNYPNSLAGSRSNSPRQPPPSQLNNYAHAVILGMGGYSNPQLPLPESGPHAQSARVNPPLANPIDPPPSAADPPPPFSISELSACCLFGKVWGDPVVLSTVINKTKKDWVSVKGQISYVDIRNEWTLIRFTTTEDENSIYFNRPWFVNGLNLVLIPWVPFFDHFNKAIDRVDQWCRGSPGSFGIRGPCLLC